jgi:hypothetical protein
VREWLNGTTRNTSGIAVKMGIVRERAIGLRALPHVFYILILCVVQRLG